MKHLLITLLVIGTGSMAFAQQAKVIKTKGQQAIVQFPEGTKPQVGQWIEIGGDGSSPEPRAHVGGGSRKNLLGVSSELSFLNTTPATGASTSRTAFGVDVRYGWNQGFMEFGPIAIISYASEPSFTTRDLGGGGFFDFNFIENVPGVAAVYGVGAVGTFGQKSETIGSQETSSTTMKIFAGGNAKWFGLNDSLALRADVGGYYERLSATATTTKIGLLVKAGLGFYF